MIARKQLLKAFLGNRRVTSVDIDEILMNPGQQSGRHQHPCAVVGYIVDGIAVYQVEGQDEQMLATGTAIYEPANATIAKFVNTSDVAPMTFVAYYLLDGEQELIRMMEQSPVR